MDAASVDAGFRKRLALLTLVALGLRIAFVLLEPKAEPMGDEPSWTALGMGLVHLKRPLSLHSTLLFYPPGYPYFVAVAFLLSGTLESVRWLQAVVGALLVPAVGLVGVGAFTPRIALGAAAAVAVYPDLIWYAGHFWSETLFLTLLWWGLARALHGGPGTAGVLFGLAALTRETALYFVPIVALWFVFGQGRAGRRAAAVFLLGATLTVAPWTVRNQVVFGAFVPISTFGAFNLWQANTPVPREQVIRESDSVEGPVAQYRLASRRAFEAIAARQPWWIVEKIRAEVPAFWAFESQLVTHLEEGAYGPATPAVVTVVTWITLAPYGLALAGFLPGLLRVSLTRERILLLGFLIYYNALHVVAFGSARFRLAVMPVVILWAVAFAARWSRDG